MVALFTATISDHTSCHHQKGRSCYGYTSLCFQKARPQGLHAKLRLEGGATVAAYRAAVGRGEAIVCARTVGRRGCSGCMLCYSQEERSLWPLDELLLEGETTVGTHCSPLMEGKAAMATGCAVDGKKGCSSRTS